jgi:hypothetical protein
VRFIVHAAQTPLPHHKAHNNHINTAKSRQRDSKVIIKTLHHFIYTPRNLQYLNSTQYINLSPPLITALYPPHNFALVKPPFCVNKCNSMGFSNKSCFWTLPWKALKASLSPWVWRAFLFLYLFGVDVSDVLLFGGVG